MAAQPNHFFIPAYCLFKQQEAQRIAQAATVKMRIPMLLLILVPFMVLLLGPALLQIGQLLL
jgi:hypothetical protein